MRRYVLASIVALFASVFAGSIDRVFNSPAATSPFPLRPDIVTSVGWYWDYLGDLASFSLFMLSIIMVMHPVYEHFKQVHKTIYFHLYVFTKMWQRVFWVIFVTSIIDLLHFLFAARQFDGIFLIQNGLFLLMTGYFIYKAYRK